MERKCYTLFNKIKESLNKKNKKMALSYSTAVGLCLPCNCSLRTDPGSTPSIPYGP